ncbi:MAG: DUF4252 domain-containing protein [Bacteroidales bacterium]|jgi:hypothetical protein|nr:DUF4252 domain-containing protein [Bacteroidales bacterium]
MRTLVFIMLAVVTMTAYAQRSPVEKFIKKQKKVDGISMQEIDLKSEEFAAQFQVEGGDIAEMLEQLEVIRILSSDSAASQAVRDSFIENARKALDSDDYNVLVNVHADGEDEVGIYTRPINDGLIGELVVLVGETDDVIMIYVKGKIDMSKTLSSDIISNMIGGKKSKDCD